MRARSWLWLPIVWSCTPLELDQEQGRSAVARPLEDCPAGDCRGAGGGIAGIVAEAAATAQTRASDPRLPSAPSLRITLAEAATAAELRDALEAIPRGEASRAPLLLRLSSALGRDGDHEAKHRVLLELVRDYPTSELIPGVYARFGDHYFDHGEYGTAAKLYDKAAQFRDARMAAYGEYMTAWCHALAPKPACTRSLEAFVKAADRATHGATTAFDGFSADALREAALVELVLPYHQVGHPERFVAFYERLVTDDDPPDLLSRATASLGSAYARAEMVDEAEALCRSLQARRPDEDCRWP